MNYVRMASAMIAACLFIVLFLFSLQVLNLTILSGLKFSSTGFYTMATASVAITLAVYFLAKPVYRKIHALLDKTVSRSAAPLVEWEDKAKTKSILVAIVALSAVMLLLELVLIRWQGSLFPVFALYKNFTLLACFCGIGIGFALAHKSPITLPATLPVLSATIVLLLSLRYALPNMFSNLFMFVPVREETSVVLSAPKDALASAIFNIPVFALLIITFILNTLVMIPLAQYCGRLMTRAKPLTAYGCNLLGSIIGVMALFAFSSLWIGPVGWFITAAVPILWYLTPSVAAQRVGLAALAIVVLATAWPVEPLVQSIYSPYQLIQRNTKQDGLMIILSSGTYYQKVYNLSESNPARNKEPLKKIVGYYELPFHTARKLDDVLIVGAGSGNDAAAALRVGAKNVDAVEIDPAILQLGLVNHPENPYKDKRVRPIANDARTFIRQTDKNYDAIVYGVLDSHVLLSHGSNVRVDSFVYTSQGLAEAFSRLKPGGLLSVSFALTSEHMGQKIYLMLKNLPGAGDPLAVHTVYDHPITYTFMVSKGQPTKLPASFASKHGYADNTDMFADAPTENVDLPTDDWPFFYMDAKMYPMSYVISLMLVLALSAVFMRGFIPEWRWDKSMLPFFFLGGGFMLVETKAITELGLLFGNTWQVVGITIIGVLVMAFAANFFVSRVTVKKVVFPFSLLLIAVAGGYIIATTGGFAEATPMMRLAAVILLTLPMLFSGIIFSVLLKNTKDVPQALAYNLMGAMLGGLLEYNAMQFGFSFLYLLALALYALAWVTGPRVR